MGFEKFKRVNIDLYAICKRVLHRHEKDIEELNRSQLLEGKRSDGTILPPYSAPYAKRKNKPLRPKTLKDTGGFHEGIFTTFFEKTFNIESSDYKSDILETVWGTKIFGLTKENKQKLLTDYGVKSDIIKEVKKALKNV